MEARPTYATHICTRTTMQCVLEHPTNTLQTSLIRTRMASGVALVSPSSSPRISAYKNVVLMSRDPILHPFSAPKANIVLSSKVDGTSARWLRSLPTYSLFNNSTHTDYGIPGPTSRLVVQRFLTFDPIPDHIQDLDCVQLISFLNTGGAAYVPYPNLIISLPMSFCN